MSVGSGGLLGRLSFFQTKPSFPIGVNQAILTSWVLAPFWGLNIERDRWCSDLGANSPGVFFALKLCGLTQSLLNYSLAEGRIRGNGEVFSKAVKWNLTSLLKTTYTFKKSLLNFFCQRPSRTSFPWYSFSLIKAIPTARIKTTKWEQESSETRELSEKSGIPD